MAHGAATTSQSQSAFDFADLSATSSGARADAITIPDAHFLFTADFKRSGDDLKLTGEDGRVVVLHDYFGNEKHPALRSPEGAALTGDIVAALAGPANPGQYAQAGAPQSAAAEAIGRVAAVSGNATVVRNGVAITLNAGDVILKGDVLQTGSGSTLGVTFADGTTFNLTADARLVVNEFVYDPNGSANATVINLVQGAASFVAGQIAKTGDMKVGTPVATMGIRGTAMVLDISAIDGHVTASVIDQHDNITHEVLVYDPNGALIGKILSNGGQLVLTPTANFGVIAQETGKTVAQVAAEFAAFQGALNTYEAAKQFFPNLPEHTDANPNVIQHAQGTQIIPPDNTGPKVISDSDTHVTVTLTTGGGTGGTGGDAGTGGDKIVEDHTQKFDVTVPTNPAPFFETGTTITRVGEAGQFSFGPSMSADGRYVAFQTSDSQPVEDHHHDSGQQNNNNDGDIYLFDRVANKLVPIALVGTAPDGTHTENAFHDASISADGKFVLFKGEHDVTQQDGQGNTINFTQEDNFIYDVATGTSSYIGSDFGVGNLGGGLVVEMTGQSGNHQIQTFNQSGQLVDTISGNIPDDTSAQISADGHYITFRSDGSQFTIDGKPFDFSLVPNIGTDSQIFV